MWHVQDIIYELTVVIPLVHMTGEDIANESVKSVKSDYKGKTFSCANASRGIC